MKEPKKEEGLRYFLIRTAKQDILFLGTEKMAREIEHECRLTVKRSTKALA